MKKTIHLIFWLFVSLNVRAQSLSPTIINSSGGSSTVNGIIYDYSFGEMTMIQTFTTPNLIVSQGLLQTRTDTAANGIDKHQLFAPVVSIFPNPTLQEVCFESEYQFPGKLHYELTDMEGRKLSEKELSIASGKIREMIDVSNLPSGVYLLKVLMNQGAEIFTQTSRIQKN